MRILFLCTDIYGGHGGIALFNREFAATLTSLPECEELVVLPRVIPRPGEHDVPAKVRFVAEAARGALAYVAALWRELRRRGRFDLVICGHVNLLPLARLASKQPLLVTHGVEAWKPLRDPLSNALVHRCRGIISVSAVTRDRLRGWSGYQGPMYVLPNAIRAERYGIRPKNPALVERYKVAGKRVLLTVGRMDAGERYKGFDEVMEVLPSLPEDVVYMIAGGGNDVLRLQQKAVELGVGGRIAFTGIFAEEEKPDLYNLADVYVMPSRGEGFGFVFLEALASGVPVIASTQDGGREALLNGELGVLVEPGDAAELRRAIEQLLAQPARAVPEGLAYFSFENFERRVHEIMRAVMKI
ncbi:MAG TPA: glycosyltransferase family 4 protein [Thermoanaerobaculia bacterium]|jgi:glycosyltransferase involved in cell wall biosynthesis